MNTPQPAHDCRHTCPAGGHCTCTNLNPHEYHVCSDRLCYCHTQKRYDLNDRREGRERVLRLQVIA